MKCHYDHSQVYGTKYPPRKIQLQSFEQIVSKLTLIKKVLFQKK